MHQDGWTFNRRQEREERQYGGSAFSSSQTLSRARKAEARAQYLGRLRRPAAQAPSYSLAERLKQVCQKRCAGSCTAMRL